MSDVFSRYVRRSGKRNKTKIASVIRLAPYARSVCFGHFLRQIVNISESTTRRRKCAVCDNQDKV
jgi:hypothetical protein